jgi:hypothetical protein
MKKRYLSFLAILTISGIAITPADPANAASNSAKTVISGYVYDTANNNAPMANANVSVSCLDPVHGDYTGGGHDTTDSTGAYLIVLSPDQCPKYSTVLGGASDSVNAWYAHGRHDAEPATARLNIAYLNLGVIRY